MNELVSGLFCCDLESQNGTTKMVFNGGRLLACFLTMFIGGAIGVFLL